MYIKLFKSSYKRDFSVTYSTDYNHRVKDGFFYYKGLKLLERNRDDIVFFFKEELSYEFFQKEFKTLYDRNAEYFKTTFDKFDYDKKCNFITYCWIKVRLKKIRKLRSYLRKPNPIPGPVKKKKRFKVVW